MGISLGSLQTERLYSIRNFASVQEGYQLALTFLLSPGGGGGGRGYVNQWTDGDVPFWLLKWYLKI